MPKSSCSASTLAKHLQHRYLRMFFQIPHHCLSNRNGCDISSLSIRAIKSDFTTLSIKSSGDATFESPKSHQFIPRLPGPPSPAYGHSAWCKAFHHDLAHHKQSHAETHDHIRFLCIKHEEICSCKTVTSSQIHNKS